MKVHTYQEMNKKIVEFLRIDSANQIDQYAAQRIEDLEAKVVEATRALSFIKGLTNNGSRANKRAREAFQALIQEDTP